MSALLGHNNPPLPTLPYNWYYVTPRFKRFLSNLTVSESDKHREAGLKKFNNVVASLNRRYYDHSSDTLNGIVIGSWGKHTQINPPRDVDALFLLPDHVYHRFNQRVGNHQSQLLQEVKDALLVTNPRTEMRATCPGRCMTCGFASLIERNAASAAGSATLSIMEKGTRIL
jgi:hypothetical protein